MERGAEIFDAAKLGLKEVAVAAVLLMEDLGALANMFVSACGEIGRASCRERVSR